MRLSAELEETTRFVPLSGGIVLECSNCGERLVLLGREEDWRSKYTDLVCGCGKKLTLEERADEEASIAKGLPRFLSGLLRWP